MDSVELCEAIEANSAANSQRATGSCKDHGRKALEKIMALDEKSFKNRFRMNKSTFRIITAEVIIDFCNILFNGMSLFYPGS